MAREQIKTAIRLYGGHLPYPFQKEYDELLKATELNKFMYITHVGPATKPPSKAFIVGLAGSGKTTLINSLHMAGSGSEKPLITADEGLDASSVPEEDVIVKWHGQDIKFSSNDPHSTQETFTEAELAQLNDADEVLYTINLSQRRFDKGAIDLFNKIGQGLVESSKTSAPGVPDWSKVKLVITAANLVDMAMPADMDSEEDQTIYVNRQVKHYIDTLNKAIREKFPGSKKITKDQIYVAGFNRSTKLRPDYQLELWTHQLYLDPTTKS